MTLKERISADMKTAMKAGDSGKLMTLRGLIAVLNNKGIEKRVKIGKEEPLTDDEVMSALMTEAKKRKESIDVFAKAGRTDLSDNEAKELVVIQEYLPKQLSAAETEQAVTAALAKSGSKEFGPAMKAVMAELRGKADAALVTEIVKKKARRLMLYVEVLDKKAARYKKTVVKTARWLIQRFKKGGFYVEIALVGNKTMKKNVYSYQAKPGFPYPGIKSKPLGEIYLNPTYIVNEGEKVEFMLIHGFLHLLGYDHVKKNDTMVMERLEAKLLKELGLTR